MESKEEASPLDRAREQLDAASAAARGLQLSTAHARRRLTEAQRSGRRDSEQVTQAAKALAKEQGGWRKGREALRRAQDTYRSTLGTWLGRDEAKDFERLSAEYPILFLPARIETRFLSDVDNPELRVRLYPDEIAGNTHEPELTGAERTLGEKFWTDGWNPANELAAWQALLGQLTPTRAAWVAGALTPTNLAERPGTAPVFPAVPLKDGSWSRAAEARMLPDRWIVVCYRGGQEVRRAVSGPIVTPLALTLAPQIEEQDQNELVDISGDGLLVDRDVLWTVNFAEAERVGMALRIPISAADVAAGFERVYAIGVRGSLTPEAGATETEALIDAHHYGRGLAFVPEGTPSNNLSGKPSGYPPPDPEGEHSFHTERGAPRATAGTDAARLASALGISASVFEHIASADRIEHQHAAAMNALLWPVTWGYFFQQLMRESLGAEALKALQEFFIGTVHGRGPLPLFRVSGTPYGILTVSALDSWQIRKDDDPVARSLPDVLRALLPTWTKAIEKLPRAGRTGDPDRDLLELLELDASAREVWIRGAFGGDFARNLGAFLEADLTAARPLQAELRARLEGFIGPAAANARVVDFLFEENGRKFNGGLVSDAPVSEEAKLDFNYLAWIKPPTSIDDIRHERLPAGVKRPGSLLYRLVRQAILTLYRNAALDLKINADLAQVEERYERELIGIIDGTEERKTTWQHFEQVIPNVTGDASLGEYLPLAAAQFRATEVGRFRATSAALRVTFETVALKAYSAALETLQNVPTAELERLTGETLDCCSHRLDAWITSLATQRLARMRAVKPRGVHVGAFAWVENLRADRPTRLRPNRRDDRVPMQAGDGGYIHAPTLDQATAGAILRNAYLTRCGEARAPYALDLSSERVRLARWLLANVREGQSFTALLGYRFERALHERQLDRFIEPLRLRFPLPAAAEAVGPSPQESVAPRDVVHGLGLRRAWLDEALNLDTLTTEPPPSAAEKAGLAEELGRLDQTFDAVADLLTADSTYQLVRGAQSRAGASLDALASELRPPEGEFAQAPRSGTMLTHRVVLVIGGEPPSPAGWNAPLSPRATAEPRLDRWLGARLGPPGSIRARVTVPAPTVNAPDTVNTITIALGDLGLRPLDFLALVPPSGARLQGTVTPHADDRASRGSELERRIVAAALGATAQKGTVRIDLGRDPAWPANVRSFAEGLEIARVAKSFVGGARALRPADLVAPEHSGQAASADLLTAEADGRAAAAISALNTRLQSLEAAIAAIPAVAPGDPEPNLGPLRAELAGAALFGITDAYPALPNSVYTEARILLEARIGLVNAAPPPADLEPLRDALRRAQALGISVQPNGVADAGSAADSVATLRVANTVSQTLAERAMMEVRRAREALLRLAASVRDVLVARQTAASTATTADQKLKAVFGSDFVWVPRFKPVRTAELDAALAQGPALGATSEDKQRWLSQAAQVRGPLRRWRRLALYTAVTGTAPGEFDLVQVPHVDPARWVGLPFATEADRPAPGRASLALFRASRPAAADPWCGLVIDEWPEIIPAREETGGLTFHYDDPGAEASQCLLLAVPPTVSEHWSLATVISILDEALMLAKIRAVHAEQLTDLGQLLPAIYLASNARDDTVSTDFSKHLAVAAPLVFQDT